MNKILFGILALIALLVGGFFVLNQHIYNEKQEQDPAAFEPYRATLTGEQVCLPHKDTSGPQTLECAIGLKTDVGEYYAIDMSLMSQEHQPITNGERFTANGMVTPIERLSTDHWQKYDVEGIFSITDSVVIERR
jgi:hypothetical protein